MKLMLRFLKPHWKLTLLTIVLLFVDVAGALFIPTLVAEMLTAAPPAPPLRRSSSWGPRWRRSRWWRGRAPSPAATPAPLCPPRWARTSGRPSTPSL